MNRRMLTTWTASIAAVAVLSSTGCGDNGDGDANASADGAAVERSPVVDGADHELSEDPTGAQTETEQRRGPDPTTESIAAEVGPFEVASVSVPTPIPGFGGGTIYHPTDLSEGPFGAYAFAPGTFMTDESYAWLGSRIASHGFVVFLINTNDPRDRPESRGEQLGAALDYLVDSSALRDQIDPNRLAVGGHSNGGGGALEAARRRPDLQAVVALQPWHPTTKSFPDIDLPTIIIGAENDDLAGVAVHSEPMYESIRRSAEKAYLELRGKPHDVATQSDPTQAAATIAWLKRYVDNDTRYAQFLCPPPQAGPTISEYRDTCPA